MSQETTDLQETLESILADDGEEGVPAAPETRSSWEIAGFGGLEAFVCERLEALPNQPIVNGTVKANVEKIMSAEKVEDLSDISTGTLETIVEELRRSVNGHLGRLDDFAPRVARAMPIERESDFI